VAGRRYGEPGVHHLAGVYAGETYKLYRDGELIAEQADDFAPTPVDAPWAIGGRSTPTPGEVPTPS